MACDPRWGERMVLTIGMPLVVPGPGAVAAAAAVAATAAEAALNFLVHLALFSLLSRTLGVGEQIDVPSMSGADSYCLDGRSRRTSQKKIKKKGVKAARRAKNSTARRFMGTEFAV